MSEKDKIILERLHKDDFGDIINIFKAKNLKLEKVEGFIRV